MNRIAQDKFALRHEVVRYAETHGLRAAARRYECSRTTVRLWFHRWKDGDDALADHSRRPHHSPKRTSEAVAAKVIAAREKAPCFGARRLVDMFELPVGKGAAHRILRDEKLIRPRPRKHQRKADLRAIKAAQPPLLRLQMDTKYLNDIPHYFPQMQQPGMPRFQYTIRCEALGALFLTYSCELSKTYATLTLQRVLAHLAAHGLDLTQLVVRTDLGTEFDGDTVHYRDDGFHGALTAVGATHRFNPPAHPNANADVESSHATIEPEFFDLESFRDPAHFLAAATTYQHFFNFARKNRSRGNFTPADLLATRAPHLSPKILLLPPILLDAHVGQDLSGPPALYIEAMLGCATSNRHSVVAAIDHNLRSRKKSARIVTRHQEGSTHEFAGLAESFHRGMADDRRDAFGRKNLAILLCREKTGHQRIDAHVLRRPLAREIF